MKKYLFILSTLFVAGGMMTSCNEWDDHYNSGGESGDIPTQNIYEYLKEDPKFSKFVELMDDTGVAAELQKNQILTVWAVSNDNMPANYDEYSPDEIVRLAKHQVNYMSLPSNKFAVSKRFKTMTKKNIIFTKTAEGNFALDGKEIIAPDAMCANGVVNEIMGLMIPRDNVLETIAKLDDSYSRLRDTILSYCDTVFDENSSFPIGVDDEGNTIYDTVFKIVNIFFDAGGEFFDEDCEFTFFKMNNSVVEAALASAVADFGGNSILPYEFNALYYWVLTSYLYEGYEFTYDRNEVLTSLWERSWRTYVQRVADRNYVRGSNCVTYDVSFLYIPRSILLSDIIYDIPSVFYPEVVKNRPEMLSTWFNHTPVGADVATGTTVSLNPLWVSSGTWWYLGMTPHADETRPLVTEFTVLKYNSRGQVEPARFLKGMYDVEVSMRPYAGGNINISFNGVSVATDLAVSTLGETSGVVYKKPELKDGQGKYNVTDPGPLVIKMEQVKGNATAGNKRITLNGWKFYPDKSIY